MNRPEQTPGTAGGDRLSGHRRNRESRAARSLNPLAELTLARMREFVREPEAIFWVFVFPVLLALALGVAFRNRPPERLRIGVDDRLPDAREIVGILAAAAGLEPEPLSQDSILRGLRAGTLELAIGPGTDGFPAAAPKPAGEAGREPGGGRGSYTFLFDATRPEGRLARLSADEALQRGLGRQDAVRVEERPITETGWRYIDFLIPGLIGLNLLTSGMWGIGFNVVDARNRKLLKLLTATPMRRSHFLLAFMLSRLLFLILEVVALVGFGRAVFGVKVHGSILALSAVLLLGAVTFAGMGVLVAARPRTIEAVSGWMNFVMLPMWLLSGSFFSYSRFPLFLQPLIRLLPLTALNDALRSIMNEGASLRACWSEACVLIAWGLVSFVVALRIFRWQ